MIKLINEATGKSSITIHDNGDLTLTGDAKILVDGKDIAEALEKAKKAEE